MQLQSPDNPQRLRQLSLFAKNFIKHPTMLGSFIPSSRFLIDRVLQHVDWSRARVMVEFGPGVGVFTREILRRMRPDAKLIVFEINPDFVDYLQDTIDDERLHVTSRSAEEMRAVLRELEIGEIDYVLSGIPFTTIPREVGEQILHDTSDLINPDGRLLVYQFMRTVAPMLARHFRSISRDFEPLNAMPAFVFSCRK
jgi:phospholipid N-methyltransferase